MADDHLMVAEGLGRMIGEVADLVARVGDGRRLVETARTLQPDIVISDITMPLMSGLDAMRLLLSEQSKARFILLTMHAEARLAAEAMRAGASGYLLKHSAGEELLDAIRTVMTGGTFLSPHIARDVLRAMTHGHDGGCPQLTPRQKEVLLLIAQGKRMKEIALALNISVRTVEDHKAQLLHVLDLKTTTDLVKFAIKRKMVDG